MIKKEYKVSIHDHDLNPEETLPDSFSGHESMEVPITPSVFKFFGVIVFGVLLLLILTTFRIQVLNGKIFAALSLENSALPYAVSPPRGIIYDYEGEPIVRNIPSFDIVVVSRELSLDSIEGAARTLGQILGENPEKLAGEMEEGKKQSVFFLRKGIKKEQAIEIESLKVSGLYTVANAVRDYIYGPKTSHIIGYVSTVSPEDLKNDTYYRTTDVVGRLGVESYHEKELRGEHGAVQFEKDINSYIFEKPTIGNSLILNINSDLQVKLYDTLASTLAANNLTRAAAVIQDPNDGSVLAMVSFPSFNSNAFVGSLSGEEYNRYFNDDNKPLFNRVISGRYNPGSSIKPLIALAALEEKVIDPLKIILSTAYIEIPNQFDPAIKYLFHDWKPHGWVDMKAAIANSSNIYFYTIGGGFGDVEGLGLERIRKFLKLFRADKKLGIDLSSETSGFIPSEEWKLETFGESWFKGDTFNISIGQGDLLVTPLWLNSYTVAVANGGTIYQPRIAKSVVDEDKRILKEFEPKIIGRLPISEDSFEIVKEGMREVTLTGTARSLSILPVSAGAKTGTVQVGSGTKNLNSVFNVFAPFEDPELTLTVLIEEVPNQNLATGVAREVLGWYFSQLNNNVVK